MLDKVVAAVEGEAERLVEEFHRPGGPRGHDSHCDVDREIEERLRQSLQAILPAAVAGEETGTSPGTKPGFTWLVDPHDGTFEFMQGRRGSAVSVALLRGAQPVLGVVCSPMSPDRGHDTIAWAEGASSILRNGRPVTNDLSRQAIYPDAFVWAAASSAPQPVAWSIAVGPARDGGATVSLQGVNEYDIAAGMALIAAANGVVLDAEGREVVLQGNSVARVSGVFAGAAHAARQLCRYDWNRVEHEPRREPRTPLGFRRNSRRLERAQGALLGQVIGDSLGSQVEYKSAAEIARLFPRGVREPAGGGPYRPTP